MKIGGGSELARMQSLQGRAVATRNALDRAALEFTTYQKASRYEATGGNLTRLFALERSIYRTAVFSENISLTSLRLDVMQEAMGRILAPAEQLAVNLSTASGLGDVGGSLLHAQTARRDFAAAVGALNTQVAGQSLFAGIVTDGPALAAPELILADLDALAAGAATPADAIAAIEAYFAPGGAFLTTRYLGAADALTPVEIGDGERLDYGVQATAQELVGVLRAQSLAAVVAGGAFAGDEAAQLSLIAEAGDRLLSAKEGLLDLRGHVGSRQEAVERARAARIAEHDTYDLARAKIIGVDPVEAASRFQALETQLTSIYEVTMRLSNLRFTNFMR